MSKICPKTVRTNPRLLRRHRVKMSLKQFYNLSVSGINKRIVTPNSKENKKNK